MKIVTAEEMRQIDRDAAAKGLPTAILMANAGKAVAQTILDSYGEVADREVLILVGPGNNGGDGLVAANHLHDWGANVALYLWSRQLDGDANFEATQRRGIPYARAEEDVDENVELVRLRNWASKADIFVDALLGTGKARAITGLLKHLLLVFAQARAKDAFIVAVDLPTGLDADTAAVEEVTPPANLTVTLGFPKPGLFLLPGAAYVGRLVVADIGLPPEPESASPLEMVTARMVKPHLPLRPSVSHKGSFGKAMIVAGSVNYIGAPFLACMGAGRVGAGLVTLGCANTIFPIMAGKLVETTFLPLPDSPPGLIRGEAVDLISRSVPNYDTVLLGPGLGQHPATLSFVEQWLRWANSERTGKFTHLSWVIDADGLNALTRVRRWTEIIPPKAILTPHPAEMARLLGVGVADIQADRLGMARRAAAEWQRVVVLKGANTIVAAPDGQTMINPSANPALATAGTGDVLAGAIAGFLAQGVELKWAAVAGVFVHGLAGEIIRDVVGEAGALAGDLLDVLPEAMNQIKEAK